MASKSQGRILLAYRTRCIQCIQTGNNVPGDFFLFLVDQMSHSPKKRNKTQRFGPAEHTQHPDRLQEQPPQRRNAFPPHGVHPANQQPARLPACFGVTGEETTAKAVTRELKITSEQRIGADILHARASYCGQFTARGAPSCTRHVSQQEQLVGNC